MQRSHVILVSLLLALTLVVGLLSGWLIRLYLPMPTQVGSGFSTPAVLSQVQTLSKFVTVKYVLEKVVFYEDMHFLGEDRVLLLASGVAQAGVDLGDLKAGDIEIRDQSIRIRLPEPEIVSVFLDESQTRVIDRSTGLLRRADKHLEHRARQQALLDLRSVARRKGILQDAETEARDQMNRLLRALGFTEVEILSADQEETTPFLSKEPG